MSFYKKIPTVIDLLVEKAVSELAKKCKPCLIIKGKQPDEMMLLKKSIMDDYWTSQYAKIAMSKLASFAYHKGVLDGIEKSQSREIESIKSVSFRETVGLESKARSQENLFIDVKPEPKS